LKNIFSLVKNIFYRIKNPKKILYLAGCIVVLLGIFYLLFMMPTRVFWKRLLVVFAISIFFFIPFILKAINTFYNKFLLPLADYKKSVLFLMIISGLSLAVLAGFYIPSSVIASSPDEFCFINDSPSPFTYIIHSFLFYFSVFFL